MNTPAHLALSVFIWRTESGWQAAAVSIGALLPDMPMIAFYAYQKWLGTPEQIIWASSYFEKDWQLFFNLFNSIPITLTIVLVSHLFQLRLLFLLAANALLHIFFDLPLHHDDAHRHFLPLSEWRFESPVSYWNPLYYGNIVIRLELVFVLLACAYVSLRGPSTPMRAVAFCTLLVYTGFMFFAFSHWG
jgi:hypothetical protein